MTPLPTEIFLGLVAPIGVDLSLVHSALKASLKHLQCDVQTIKVSEGIVLSLGLDERKIGELSHRRRIECLMDGGTYLRETSKRADFLALVSASRVILRRKKLTEEWRENNSAPKTVAYVFDQLKHPNEVRALRDIYGPNFFLIAAHSRREKRKKELQNRIALNSGKDEKMVGSQAEALIERDENEDDHPMGQRFSDTFPLADFFVDLSDSKKVAGQVDRFIRLLFGEQFLTPTRDEQGVYLAFGAAVRSSDLSRQVGAAICSERGEVLTLGCNDAPQAGGGQFWDDTDRKDTRDHAIGKDAGVEYRVAVLTEVFERLKKGGLEGVSVDSTCSSEALAKAALLPQDAPLKGTKIAATLEFNRSVHAEMHAITEAAARGVALRGAVMYVTTFPCHLCARHIVSSGIERVVYVEPYSKSRAEELFGDSIVVDAEHKLRHRVVFERFSGIGHRQYQELFRASPERKSPDGKALKEHSAHINRYWVNQHYLQPEENATLEWIELTKKYSLNVALPDTFDTLRAL